MRSTNTRPPGCSREISNEIPSAMAMPINTARVATAKSAETAAPIFSAMAAGTPAMDASAPPSPLAAAVANPAACCGGIPKPSNELVNLLVKTLPNTVPNTARPRAEP